MKRSLIFTAIIFCYIIFLMSTSSNAGTYTTIIDGLWSNDLIWNSAPSENDCAPSGNHTFNIDDSVTVACPGGIKFTGKININVRNGGVLYVAGDGDVSGNVNLNVENGGRVIVLGDWNSGGNSDVIIDGYFEVQGEITSDGGSYVFDCDGNSDGGTTVLNDGQCAVCTNGSGGCSMVLPVEFIAFDIMQENKGVALNWSTATEENNDYFSILRSQDGIYWEVIGYVDGSGNSTEIKSYRFVDETNTHESVYYKIQQTDFDGKSSESSVRHITISSEKGLDLTIYPNPVSSGTQLNIIIKGVDSADEIKYTISDMTGKIILEGEYTSSGSDHRSNGISLSHNLAEGTYLVSVSSNESISYERLVVR